MIPAAFDYRRPSSVDEAIAVLGDFGDDAKVLAGGHSLLPLMKLRLATPEMLIDIGRLSELSYVRAEGDELAIGSLTRHHELATSPLVAEVSPLLSKAAATIGDPQVRHRGTIGGSLAHGDAASDLPAALLALGGSVVVAGPGGERTVPAVELFEGFLQTAVGYDELVVEVRVPRSTGGAAYQKFTRRSQDWAMVGVAVATTQRGVGVALANMGSVPIQAVAVQEALAGGATASEAAQLADEGTDPLSDANASAQYRRHLARVLTLRALVDAGV